MLKVLLIDDEIMITKGLQKLVDWKSLDMTVVDTAGNATEGLKKATEIKPDIVITDIKMYEMSGLDFAESYKKINPACKIVALSGFSDFSYVKRALELGFFNYLLKPVDKKELVKVLKEAKEQIMQENAETKVEDENALTLTKFYKAALFDSEITPETLEEQAKELNILDDYFQVGALSFDIKESSLDNEDATLDTLLDKIKVSADDNKKEIAVLQQLDAWYVIVNDKKPIDSTSVQQDLTTLYEGILSATGMSVQFGTCAQTQGISQLKACANMAKTALVNAFFVDSPISVYEQTERFKSNINTSVNNFEKKILERILYLSDDDITKLVYGQMEYFLSVSNGDKDAIYNDCYALYLKIKDVIEKEGRQVTKTNVFNEITACKNISALRQWLINELLEAEATMNDIKKDREQDVVEVAKEYLKTHYQEQITIELLAKKLFVSPTYFCYLFKNKVGVGYHEYILDIRMQEAIKLLATQKYKVYEVAAKVGFANSRYFSVVFKNHFGFIPTEFDITKHKDLIK